MIARIGQLQAEEAAQKQLEHDLKAANSKARRMNFVLKMMNFALTMMNVVLKMMNFVPKGGTLQEAGG